jgi:hypothetical protein
MPIRGFVLASVAAALLAGPAAAHHSFAMFDANKTTSVSGTVKEFEWLNPHAWVHLVAPNASGKPVTWSFEAGSTGQLATSGWKSDTLKEGDKITLAFHPLKDGSYGGQLLSVTLADGKMLCQGAACRAAAEKK